MSEIKKLFFKDLGIPDNPIIADESVFESELIESRKEMFNRLSGYPTKYLKFEMDMFKKPKFANMLNLVRLFYTKIKRHETVNMIVCGPVGTGKTAITAALLKEIYILKKKEIKGVKIFFNVRYILSSNLVRLMSKTQYYTDKNYNETIKKERLENCDVCVIDEVGKEIEFEPDKYLINFLEKRYSQDLSTILITNMTVEDLLKYLGPTVQSRLNENRSLIVIDTTGSIDMRQNSEDEQETKLKVVK